MKISGIYKIINNINGKIYIGSAVSIKMRLYRHKTDLNCNKHPNKYLQRAWNKYGKESFIFEILEIVDDKLMLIEREQYYMNTLLFANEYLKNNDYKFKKLGYNMNPVAGSQIGVKQSDDRILKRVNTRKANGTYICTDEQKKKLSESHKGQIPWSLGKKFSDEHRQKLSISHLGKSNPNRKKILQYDLNNNFIREWDSITEAAIYYNISRSTISRVCKKIKRYRSCGGFKWEYKNG